MKSDPRIAFEIDALPALGGGEKVLFTALASLPQADLFTLVYNRPAFTAKPIANYKVKTSFIDLIPFAHTHHRMFLPLMPFAIEQFNLRDYDIVVSFSNAVAHGTQNFNGARHISYTFTPMRYAWLDLNLNGTRTRKNLILDRFMSSFCEWDKKAAARVHQFAAISKAVSQRIQNAYQRKAVIIYPPVEVDRFKPAPKRNRRFNAIWDRPTAFFTECDGHSLDLAFSDWSGISGDNLLSDHPRSRRVSQGSVHHVKCFCAAYDRLGCWPDHSACLRPSS